MLFVRKQALLHIIICTSIAYRCSAISIRHLKQDNIILESENASWECDCGPKGKCIWVESWEECECDFGFADKDGKCTECYCGENSKSCEFSWDDEKRCNCIPGYSQVFGGCFECNCGLNAESCYFSKNGTKTCNCDTGYSQDNLYCSECDCGSKGNCSFENGRKRCDCDSGFADKDGTCAATCSKDEDCNDYQKCEVHDGWKACVCADGLSGDTCERKEWCESTGKFRNCKDENGTCVYIPEKRSVDCICPPGKELQSEENRCRDCSCGVEGKCRFENGLKKCDCKRGYEDKSGTCSDIDECLNPNMCPQNTVCLNFPGDYNCKCKDGYRLEEGKDVKKDGCKSLCDPNPCDNGICELVRDNAIYCRCFEGHAGPFCKKRNTITTKPSNLFIGIIGFCVIIIVVLSGTLGYIYLNKKRI